MVLLVLLIIIEALSICLSWRSEGDSNPRAACDDYTLSRRASSTTRASLHLSDTKIVKGERRKNKFT